MTAELANPVGVRSYFFRAHLCRSWKPVGEFAHNSEARTAVGTAKEGRLGLKIGDVMLPVNDVKKGSWSVCEPRKSY